VNRKTTFFPRLAIKNSLFIWLILGGFYLLFLSPHLSIDGDNARYIILAKSIMQGKGLRFINHPDSPPAHPFTPAYPLFLIPFLLIPCKSYILLKLPSLLSLLGVLWLVKKNFHNLTYFPLFFLLIAVNPYLISYSHQIMSELPYLFFSFLTLSYLENLYVLLFAK